MWVITDSCSLQIREMFLGDVFIGLTGVDKDKALAQVCTHTFTYIATLPVLLA